MQFDVSQAAAMRHSVRTFDRHNPPSQAVCESLVKFAETIGNPFGIKSVRIGLVRKHGLENQKLGTYGVISGAEYFLGFGVPDGDEFAYVAGACQMEAAVLYAASLGIGTVWIGGTLTREAFANAFGFTNGIALAAVIPFGHPAKPRLIDKAMKFLANSSNRKPWEKLFFKNRIGESLTKEEAGIYAQALDNVRLAPSSLNSQPWRVLKVGDRFHFYACFSPKLRGAERNLKLIDLGIAICHFNATLKQQGTNGGFTRENPGIPLQNDYLYIASWTMKSQYK